MKRGEDPLFGFSWHHLARRGAAEERAAPQPGFYAVRLEDGGSEVAATITKILNQSHLRAIVGCVNDSYTTENQDAIARLWSKPRRPISRLERDRMHAQQIEWRPRRRMVEIDRE